MQETLARPTDTEPDFYNLIARERGCPSDWRWYSLEAVPSGFGRHGEDRATSSVIVKGAVCTATFTRGPRKGQTNWAKRDRTTERTIVISFADYDARVEQWRSAR